MYKIADGTLFNRKVSPFFVKHFLDSFFFNLASSNTKIAVIEIFSIIFFWIYFLNLLQTIWIRHVKHKLWNLEYLTLFLPAVVTWYSYTGWFCPVPVWIGLKGITNIAFQMWWEKGCGPISWKDPLWNKANRLAWGNVLIWPG